VLATGGLSLPRTGSDGFGLRLAQRLGHTMVETTPALVPLVLDEGFHVPLTGVSHQVELRLTAAHGRATRIRGSMLWTHFGVSGPAVLDISRHWLRERVEGRQAELTVGLTPDLGFAEADAWLVDAVARHPKRRTGRLLADRLPSAVAEVFCSALALDGTTPLGQLTRDTRRRLAHALTDWPLLVRASRGYDYAEATAGGVALGEVDPTTMHSRRCPGLFLAGEMLDVDGRLGGFNFQWAWASARAAGGGLAALLRGA
jgi:predicted Rossmann fold flavoprotein